MKALKKYSAALHSKPSAHKKRFAMLTSGAITLIIFSFWSAIKFNQPVTVAETDNAVSLAVPAAAPTPFEDVLHGISSSWHSLTGILHNGQ